MNWFKKIWKYKLSRAWFLVAAIVLVLGIVVNLVATQSMFIYNTINSVLGGEERVLVEGDPSKYVYYEKDYANKSEVLAAANALNEEIVEEGIVLLKNEGALPLATPESSEEVSAKPKISVFGKNSVNLVYGGSGSSESKGAAPVTLYESLESAGYEVNPELKSFYESGASGSGRPSNPQMGDLLYGFATGETPVSSYGSGLAQSYGEYDDLALIVISRIGGEGYDLPRSMRQSADENSGAISGADKEAHYLELDNNEKALVEYVKAAGFGKICMIINSAASMELGELEDDEEIGGIVWIGSTGRTGINALGRVLNGEVNPSGRTVDTYARDFTQDPTWANFGTNGRENGNRYYVDGKTMAYYYVEYEEGIYVGYRYWETRGETDGEDWYREHVVYPLGYGLSYTTFGWEVTNADEVTGAEITADGSVRVKVRVSNTGEVAGKDVVQIYVGAPYYGKIEKASKVLVGFAKTPELYPESEADETHPNSCEVEIEIPAYYFASYDYNDANGNGFRGYEIERGKYALYVSRNAHESADTLGLNVEEDIKIENDPDTGSKVENRFDDVSAGIETYLSRSDWEGTWPQAPTASEQNVTKEFIASLKYDGEDEGKPWYTDELPEQSRKKLSYNATKLKLYDLINYEDGQLTVDYEDKRWDELLSQLTVRQMVELIGTGNYNTMYIDNIAKPETMDPDGPVGFTAFMGDPSVYDTCFYACGCVLGATYNTELAYRMGEMVGNEGLIGNEKGDGRPYSGWYAPAVNIHRSPFSGRNWEYYSEDGYLSGIMASGVIKGAMSKGVYCYVKHFALNDQETNRSNNGILVWANEQAMREIYFRAFELTVKEGGTTAMMSGFNRIGTTWAGGSYELLTEVLRGEWKFKGMVITDYNYATPYMDVNQMIRAGGDLNLSQANLPAENNDPTQVASLRRATKNILYTVASSNVMNGLGEGVIYRYALPVWVRVMLGVDAGLAVALAVTGFFAIRRSFRLEKAAQPAAKVK